MQVNSMILACTINRKFMVIAIYSTSVYSTYTAINTLNVYTQSETKSWQLEVFDKPNQVSIIRH